MSANLDLVKERNISDENVERINAIHEGLEQLIDTYSLECDYDSTIELIRQAEYALQDLWGFNLDTLYHTWVNVFNQKHFKLQWVGRTFQCVETGAVRTIPEDIYQRQIITISGNSAIDLGVANGYSRTIGNLTEVFDHA